MAVIEYKLHIAGHRGGATQPLWVREPGHYHNPDDKTMVGWVVDNADYYVPDTITTLTKEDLVQRQLGIHANHPERLSTGELHEADPAVQAQDSENWRDKTEAEVQAAVEEWYDQYVIDCQSIER